MEENILGKVVEVEKEIQKRIEKEKQNAREWIETLRNDKSRKLADTEAELAEALEKAVEEAKTEASNRASAILKEAESLKKAFRLISEETLKAIIIKHIKSILPGG